jgi:hypothetical protein
MDPLAFCHCFAVNPTDTSLGEMLSCASRALFCLFAGVPARLKPCTKGTVEFFAISLGLSTCLENAYVLEREHLGSTPGSNGRR